MASERTSPDDVVVVEGVRTPFSKFGGALRDVPSVVLGAHVIQRVLHRAGLPAELVDEVYYGVTLPAEVALEGSVSGRQAMLRAGIPARALSLTLDRGCCSSMTAVQFAARSLRDGQANWVIAAGAENMGRATFLAPPGLRFGHRSGALTFKDPLFELGTDIGERPVAVDAGEVAVEWGVTREMQDRFAACSHQRYFAALQAGFYADHAEPVSFPEFNADLCHDELPRPGTTVEALAQLKTVYGSPTVTAGNAPGLDTGATALLLGRRSAAEARGLEPLASIRGMASVGSEPREIAVAPGPAIEKLLKPLNWDVARVDAIEINEAFAAVPLVAARYLAENDAEREAAILQRTNVRGGAVAIGHPTGASGARLVLQLAKQLRVRGGGSGVAAICGALGMADAIALSVP